MTWAVLCLCSSVALQALDLDLSAESLAEALALGRTGLESRRTEFHRPYRLVVGQAPLDYVEVVTPFRRVVLAAEARMRAGERLLGQRDALAALGDRPQQVDLRLVMTFHPLNALVGVPDYDIAVTAGPGQPAIMLYGIERIPRFGPRVEGVPGDSPRQGLGGTIGLAQPLLGGTLVASFDGRLLDRRSRYQVMILDQGKVVARASLDLRAVR